MSMQPNYTLHVPAAMSKRKSYDSFQSTPYRTLGNGVLTNRKHRRYPESEDHNSRLCAKLPSTIRREMDLGSLDSYSALGARSRAPSFSWGNALLIS